MKLKKRVSFHLPSHPRRSKAMGMLRLKCGICHRHFRCGSPYYSACRTCRAEAQARGDAK